MMQFSKPKPCCPAVRYMFAVATVFLCSCQIAHAQLSQQYPNYEAHHYKGVRYGLFKPDAYNPKKSYPLMIYLHGSTDTVSRDMIWYRQPLQKDNPCFVLTPKCDEPQLGWGDTWHDEHPAHMKKTLALVDSIISHYNIDKNRIYLCGISMGGFGVFSVLAKEQGKFAAAYAICGGSDVKAASKLTQTPLWIFHGEIDDIVPVALSRDIYHEIVRLGGKKVRYTEYPGVKHNSWENANKEEDLTRWVLAQKKK